MIEKNNTILKDIETRADIELLINEFYKGVIEDDVIGFFFTKVVKLDWKTHIPVMYDFWETTLLGNMIYKGNPMLKHIELSKKEPLKAKHFKRWLSLWETTIRENFEGKKAKEAIQKANQIADLMLFKVERFGSK